jgi:hypothetical protein
MKKVLGIDVDGCALNYLEYLFIPIVNDTFNGNTKIEDYIAWDKVNVGGRNLTKKEIWNIVGETWSDPKRFSKIPIIEGFLEFYQWASKYYQIVYITTIKPELEQARIKNLKNLKVFNPKKDKILISKNSNEKAMHVVESNVKFFIDDKPENVAIVRYMIPGVKTIWFNLNGYMKEYGPQIKPHYECQTWEQIKRIIPGL